MKILIDMNLPQAWVAIFIEQGWQALHWSEVGAPDASDEEIMTWAREHKYIIFTHDLDFGALLALTHAKGPSVIQVRTQDIMPQTLSVLLVDVLMQYETALEAGALITVDPNRSRIRILPI